MYGPGGVTLLHGIAAGQAAAESYPARPICLVLPDARLTYLCVSSRIASRVNSAWRWWWIVVPAHDLRFASRGERAFAQEWRVSRREYAGGVLIVYQD